MKIPLAQCSLALLSKFGVATHVGADWQLGYSEKSLLSNPFSCLADKLLESNV